MAITEAHGLRVGDRVWVRKQQQGANHIWIRRGGDQQICIGRIVGFHSNGTCNRWPRVRLCTSIQKWVRSGWYGRYRSYAEGQVVMISPEHICNEIVAFEQGFTGAEIPDLLAVV